ncbi:kinesin-like protein KIN-13A [Phalaenopsis equestris]|uniref:kinesin-like protein KIN-13A n=1 Tax=Phalaenopsis equestris TaxID=78828 RepID=UPI0009E3C7E8|nr:kinesin-like protein KIN-13A [Phalaenopsis equestris]
MVSSSPDKPGNDKGVRSHLQIMPTPPAGTSRLSGKNGRLACAPKLDLTSPVASLVKWGLRLQPCAPRLSFTLYLELISFLVHILLVNAQLESDELPFTAFMLMKFQHVISEEPFEASPFITQGFEDDLDAISIKQQGLSEGNNTKASSNDEETSVRENNVAKIKVVVRKRPLNKKEISRKEEDIVTVHENAYLTVHEPKLKVDLTAYVEKHEFCFDAVIDEHVTNDEVYRVTVEPIIPSIFKQTKATCFAYGQTGSGKTYTMKPLPLRAAEDIVRLLRHPNYLNQRFKLWLSYFEIYGGKLFDLLSDRRKLCMREDGRQQVCIVGLQEFEVSDVRVVNEFIEKGNAARSTGSTGANEESSRSHAILQLAIKKHKDVIDTRRPNEAYEAKSGKLIGKISFIDLAGSERGADTTDNDRQTRIEGAEINKSLLALKECIRALDNDQIHIPFRGSKLTEVLRDSFVGNSKTVMISCISPNAGSCEHTLNTLRYADRVKSLSKGGNSKKDQASVPSIPSTKESLSTSSFPFTDEPESIEAPMEKIETKTAYGSSSNHQLYFSAQNSFDGQDEEKATKVSPPRRKAPREEKIERKMGWSRKNTSEGQSTSNKQQYEQEDPFGDGEINALLEEEEALIAAHRKEIESTMEIVREEMNLLAEVDRPGSQIDTYVSQLSFLLSRKAAGLAGLQARLARFQHRLKEHEILSRKKASR